MANWTKLTGSSSTLGKPPKYILPEGTEMDAELIQAYIDDHSRYVERYRTLRAYYEGWAEINEREERENKANNKVIAPYPKYITDILTGMFVGIPVAYAPSEDEREDFEVIQECFDYNDEQDENMELAKMCSIMGEGYELTYLDDVDGVLQVRFNELPPEEVVYIWNDRINPEPLHAIRYIDTPDPKDPLGSTVRSVTHYSRQTVTEYTGGSNGLVMVGDGQKAHNFGMVPVTQFTNNNERQGDFEQLLGIINAYNKVCSDDLNYIEEFVDAILALKGMANADTDDVKVIFEDKILLLSEIQDAKWLTKDMSSAIVENTKARLDDDIHKFSFVPNMSDEKFGGNSSGVAMDYKMNGIRAVLSTKERKFKRAIQRRLELIIAGYKSISKTSTTGAMAIEYTDITVKFKPNFPIDAKANVEMVKLLTGMVSEATALSQLYFVENPVEEIQKMEEEKDRYITLEEAIERARAEQDSDLPKEPVMEDEQD